MLRFVRQHPYQAWMTFCLIIGCVLAVWAYADTARNFVIEHGLSEEMLMRAEHHRSESATAAAVGSFFLPLPFMMMGVVVIWSALRWR